MIRGRCSRCRRSEASSLLAMESDVRSAAEAVARWQDAALTVRTVRGRKMRTVGRLFDEMAAALQFPHYFGENWPAFDECLADIDWLADGGMWALRFGNSRRSAEAVHSARFPELAAHEAGIE